MDRPHHGPAGPARAGAAPVTADPGTRTGTGTGTGTAKIIEARDLFVSFGSTPALRGASIGVKPGEIVAVMGPSGSGKSTLLHCLAGILVPDQGETWYDGQRLDRLSDDRRSALRRDRFGFVFQSGQLVPELTARAMISALDPLLRDRDRRAELGRNGRRMAEAEFSLEAQLRRWEDYLGRLRNVGATPEASVPAPGRT